LPRKDELERRHGSNPRLYLAIETMCLLFPQTPRNSFRSKNLEWITFSTNAAGQRELYAKSIHGFAGKNAQGQHGGHDCLRGGRR
jgi:hypothetical protein